MSEDLFVALDNCLGMMDQGADLETCLVRYPELASELRPLLLAALEAESLTEKEIPVDVIRRSKARLLNAAAEMREQKSGRKMVFGLPFRRVFRIAFASMVVIALMAGIGGTGLVSASNRSLPGDHLYPFKRSWENFQLKLAFDPTEREALVNRFEQERFEEVDELINEGRSESVKFSGQVEGIFPEQYIVSGVTVNITPDTHLDGNILMNVWVRVEGVTQMDGVVLADRIKVVSADSGETNSGNDNSTKSSSEDNDNKNNGNSGEGESGIDKTPEATATMDSETPESESNESPEPTKNSESGNDQSNDQVKKFEIEGTVKSYNGSMIVVGNKSIYIAPDTDISGTPSEGSKVKIRGFINQNGTLVARHIEASSSHDSGGGGGDGSGDSDGNHSTRTPRPTWNHSTRTPGPTQTDDD